MPAFADLGVLSLQALDDTGFVGGAERIRVERSFVESFFHHAAKFAQLNFHIIGFQTQQHGRGFYARALALIADLAKAQHALVERGMTWVNFDQDIRAAIELACMDIGNMKERG